MAARQLAIQYHEGLLSLIETSSVKPGESKAKAMLAHEIERDFEVTTATDAACVLAADNLFTQ